MKLWISAFATDRGIFEVEGSLDGSHENSAWATVKGVHPARYRPRDWHYTKEKAASTALAKINREIHACETKIEEMKSIKEDLVIILTAN